MRSSNERWMFDVIIENKIDIEEIKNGLLESFPKMRIEKSLSREKIIEDINNISCYEDAISVITQIVENFVGYISEHFYFSNDELKYGVLDMNRLCSYLVDLTTIMDENNRTVYTEISEKFCMNTEYIIGTEIHDAFDEPCIDESCIKVTLEYDANITEETLLFHTWERAKLLLPFSALRKQTGLSQAEFADKFHISKGTLTNWEQGVRTPPEYVPFMIETILRYEEAFKNIRSNILEEKHSVVKEHYSNEVLRVQKKALNTALDIVEEEHEKLVEAL